MSSVISNIVITIVKLKCSTHAAAKAVQYALHDTISYCTHFHNEKQKSPQFSISFVALSPLNSCHTMQ